MIAICDFRLPEGHKDRLSQFYNVIEFSAKGMVEKPLEGHPDIFICQNENHLIIAPNISSNFLNQLKTNKIEFNFGENEVGFSYPEVARYNNIITQNFILCNSKTCDTMFLEMTDYQRVISVKQSFCRCSSFALTDDFIITSDAGVYKKLQSEEIESVLFSCEDIVLEGYKNGLLGGCLGLDKNNGSLVVSGSMERYSEGEKLKKLISSHNLEILELGDSPLIDVGGIFVL